MPLTDEQKVNREATQKRIAEALENLMPLQAAPYVATIPTGQWSGSGSDYYITVTAANVTANSILIPQYDKASASLLRGAVWCVPGTGSFTIHTSAIPAGTVSIMVMFAGTMGEAQYQVLADVYSKSQVDALIAQFAAIDIVETGISDLSAVRVGKVVELVYNSISGIAVSAGGYSYVGYLPSSLRPYANLPVCGIATNDSGEIGVVSIQSSDGRIFIRSAVQATFLYFSLTYILP